IPFYNAFTRSKTTQWTVAVGIPASIITAPLQRHITFFAAGAGALLFISLGLAMVLGRRISMPIANLAASAEAIQRGEQIQLPRSTIVREVKELHAALSAAGVAARDAARERERRLIAEAKQIEAETAKQQITYNLESMSDGYCAFDSAWRFTYVNAKAEDELVRQRFSKNDLLGRVLWEVFPEEAGTGWQKALMGAMRDRVPASLSFYYPPLNYWYEDRIYPAPDGGIGIFRRNITEQKLAEATLRQSEEQARRDLKDMTLLEHLSRQLVKSGEVAPLMQDVIDAAIAITRAQRGNLQLFDAESGVLKTASQRGFEKPFLESFQNVKRGEGACGIAAQRGERVIVEDVLLSEIFAGQPAQQALIDAGARAVQSTPLFSRSGELLGVISTHFAKPCRPEPRDLTLLDVLARQAADFIERCRAEETRQEMDRRKDEFLAMLGHELRNPLGIVGNFVQLLRMKAPLDPSLIELREMMARQVQHMTRLLDDLLDVSRISRGRLRLHEELCDFTEIVRATTEDYRNAIETNGLQMMLELPLQPVWVKGDRIRLAQAIGNILHNANKFTESGGTINIRVYEEPSRNSVILKVRDTGIGMEPEILTHAFEFFTQAERSADRSRGGLGLGLALVKGLVGLQGGEVRAASDGAGRGTEITVTLPREEPAFVAGKPIQWPGEGSRSYRILVIEDNRIAALSMERLLVEWGHTVELAHTGQSAIDMARTSRPEVVLCDIGLPGMDGYSVARALRQDANLAETFLIAATGYGTFEDQRRAQEAGFDVHLRKPIDFDELQRIFASLTLPYTASESSEEARKSKMRELWK
ncbi:MAG: ATP-binding protein, partial [Candidatus Binatia bacterium]